MRQKEQPNPEEDAAEKPEPGAYAAAARRAHENKSCSQGKASELPGGPFLRPDLLADAETLQPFSYTVDPGQAQKHHRSTDKLPPRVRTTNTSQPGDAGS